MPKNTAKSTTDIFMYITYSINDNYNVGHAILFQFITAVITVYLGP